MSESPSNIHIQAWAKMVGLTQKALAQIDQQLAQAGLISLAWYDVIYAVYSSPDRKLRLSDLVEEVILSKSALSRSVEKLVQEGLLKKTPCSSDSRAAWLEVTSAGKDALRKSWPIYKKGIQEHFASKISKKEAEILVGLLSRSTSS